MVRLRSVVRANAPESDPAHTYRMRDGDAAFVPAGSPVFTVKGYRPSFRLAASHRGHLRLYEADAADGARTGADLLDLAGKVGYLSVNSGRSELARIKDRPRVAELVGQVLAAPVRPTSGQAGRRHCFVVFNLTDGTAVRRAFFPATGELMPGVFAPPAFTRRSRVPWRHASAPAAGAPSRLRPRWCRSRRTGCPRGPRGR
jgi:hypothetical protein